MCALFFTFLLVLQLAALAARRRTSADFIRLLLGVAVLVVGVLILEKRFSNELILAAVPLCVLMLFAITTSQTHNRK